MNLEDLSPLESAMKRITGFLPGISSGSYSPISYDAGAANQPAAMNVTPGAAQPVTAAPTAAPMAAPAAANPAAPSVAAVPSAAASPLKRISYTEFYKGRPEAKEAMKYLGYGFYSKPAETTMGAGANWSRNPGGNPYQYRNEYNTYLGSLAPNTPYARNEEVDLARAALRRK